MMNYRLGRRPFCLLPLHLPPSPSPFYSHPTGSPSAGSPRPGHMKLPAEDIGQDSTAKRSLAMAGQHTGPRPTPAPQDSMNRASPMTIASQPFCRAASSSSSAAPQPTAHRAQTVVPAGLPFAAARSTGTSSAGRRVPANLWVRNQPHRPEQDLPDAAPTARRPAVPDPAASRSFTPCWPNRMRYAGCTPRHARQSTPAVFVRLSYRRSTASSPGMASDDASQSISLASTASAAAVRRYGQPSSTSRRFDWPADQQADLSQSSARLSGASCSRYAAMAATVA